MNPLDFQTFAAESSGRDLATISPLAAELNKIIQQLPDDMPAPSAVAEFEQGLETVDGADNLRALAKNLLDEGLDDLEEVGNELNRGHVAAKAIPALVLSGDIDGAKAKIAGIIFSGAKREALAEFVHYTGDEAMIDEIIALVGTGYIPRQQPEVLTQLAIKHDICGPKFVERIETLRDEFTQLPGHSPVLTKHLDSAFSALATIHAKLGQLGSALSNSDAINDTRVRDTAKVRVIDAYAQANYLEVATNLAATIVPVDLRAAALERIGVATGEVEDFDEASNLIATLSDEDKLTANAQSVRALAEAGFVDRALELYRTEQFHWGFALAGWLISISDTIEDITYIDQIYEKAQAIPDPAASLQVVAALAQAAARLGDVSLATTFLDTIGATRDIVLIATTRFAVAKELYNNAAKLDGATAHANSMTHGGVN